MHKWKRVKNNRFEIETTQTATFHTEHGNPLVKDPLIIYITKRYKVGGVNSLSKVGALDSESTLTTLYLHDRVDPLNLAQKTCFQPKIVGSLGSAAIFQLIKSPSPI
jgi:hypothetical protein